MWRSGGGEGVRWKQLVFSVGGFFTLFLDFLQGSIYLIWEFCKGCEGYIGASAAIHSKSEDRWVSVFAFYSVLLSFFFSVFIYHMAWCNRKLPS